MLLIDEDMDCIDLNEIDLSFPVTDDFAGMCEKRGIDRVLKALDNAPRHNINGDTSDGYHTFNELSNPVLSYLP